VTANGASRFGGKGKSLTPGAACAAIRTVGRMYRSPVVVAALFALLAGCERGAAPAAPTSAPAAGPCDTALTAKVRDRLARPGVATVTVDSACATVTVETTLSDGDATTARQLCDLAAEVAYTGAVQGLRVTGQSGKDLAVGTKGAPCRSAG
jgi:hypothetical protein